jgi:hypothetical protein
MHVHVLEREWAGKAEYRSLVRCVCRVECTTCGRPVNNFQFISVSFRRRCSLPVSSRELLHFFINKMRIRGSRFEMDNPSGANRERQNFCVNTRCCPSIIRKLEGGNDPTEWAWFLVKRVLSSRRRQFWFS